MEAKKPNLQKEISNNNEIDNLRKELKDEKNKNKTLQDTINNLNNTINQLKQEHYTEFNKLVEKNKELEKLLEEKNKEINDYIFQLRNSNNNEQLISFKPGDKIIAVLFMT